VANVVKRLPEFKPQDLGRKMWERAAPARPETVRCAEVDGSSYYSGAGQAGVHCRLLALTLGLYPSL
jgi:hypothetical protein